MLYDNLPGINLEIKDGNLVLPAEPTPSQAVLIIAPTSSTGEANSYTSAEYNPIRINGQSDFADKGFGAYNADNPMARMWKQAYDAGCRNISVIKLKGLSNQEKYSALHDIYTILEDGIFADIVLLGGIYADDTITDSVIVGQVGATTNDFASAVMTATSKGTAVTNEAITPDGGPDFILAHKPVELASVSVKINGEVVAASDYTVDGFTGELVFDTAPAVATNGTTGVTSFTITTALDAGQTVTVAGKVITAYASAEAKGSDAYGVLETDSASAQATAIRAMTFAGRTTGGTNGVVTITQDVKGTGDVTGAVLGGGTGTGVIGSITTTPGVAAASADTVQVSYKYYTYSFAAQLAGFAKTVSSKTSQLLGVMALKPPDNNNLATIKTYIDSQVTQYYNENLQVIGGATGWFNLGSGLYVDFWHGAYAGLISVLPAYSSPTFKTIPGMLFQDYNLSPNQVLSLTNKHIVTSKARNGRVTVAEAVTTAADTSDFVRLTTIRIVNDVVQVIRSISEPYIGEPNIIPRINALDTAIREALKTMVLRGALNDFRFHIKSTIADQIDGNMRIMLDIVPVFETRRILMTVAVKPLL